MTEIATIFSGSIKQLGQSFLVAFYIPATTLTAIHLYILLPIWTGKESMMVKAATQLFLPSTNVIQLEAFVNILLMPLLVSLVTLLLLSFPVGIALAVLNDVLIRIFEGKTIWLRRGLLLPLTLRNEKQCQNQSALREKPIQKLGNESLQSLQAEYRKRSKALLYAGNEREYRQNLHAITSLSEDIDIARSELAAQLPNHPLPEEKHRVAPTRFGNVYAMSEEYAYTRYGVDTVMFWPRLRQLMAKHAPDEHNVISRQKTTLDLAMNAAFVSGLLATEALLTLPFYPPTYLQPLLILFTASSILYIGFYYSAVSAMFTLGELIKNSFDYHRHLVLDAFSIPVPQHLLVERDVWIKLARFIQWGDEAYLLEAQAIARQHQPKQGNATQNSAKENNLPA